MKIYIEYEGTFYEYGRQDLESFALEVALGNKSFLESRKVEKPDFQIGDRVYFEKVGWTEMREEVEEECCTYCASIPSCPYSTKYSDCPGIFQKIKEVEKEENIAEKARPDSKDPAKIGIKHDAGKIRPGLFPMDCFEEIVKVLTYGANEYAPENWKQVPPEKYVDALWRHWIKRQTGITHDDESGLFHLAHFATNAIFLLWFELHKNASKGANQKSEDFPGVNRF